MDILDSRSLRRCVGRICLAWLTTVTTAVIAADDVPREVFHGQSCYVVRTPEVELAVTQTGGHLAPVTFFRNQPHPIRPYYISPWQDEPPTKMPVPVLVPLRGDFFCLPFGGNNEPLESHPNEKHPPHGETAGGAWSVVGLKRSGGTTALTLALETKVRPGRVTKELALVDGENVVYTTHTIEGFAGPAPLGHHATLALPDEEGSVHLATSPIQFGMTYPGTFSDPKQREYQSLLPGAKWTKLTEVPVIWKGKPDADLTRLPDRFGHADLVQLINQPSDKPTTPAWVTAAIPSRGYLWFALKDPAVLNSTVFWIENHGRHGHPWNGRNNCLGLEDVTAYFADGLAASSRKNLLNEAGIKTAIELQADRPTAVRYIQGVARIPSDFDIVKSVEFGAQQVTFIAPNGSKVTVPVRHEFLHTGKF